MAASADAAVSHFLSIDSLLIVNYCSLPYVVQPWLPQWVGHGGVFATSRPTGAALGGQTGTGEVLFVPELAVPEVLDWRKR